MLNPATSQPCPYEHTVLATDCRLGQPDLRPQDHPCPHLLHCSEVINGVAEQMSANLAVLGSSGI